MEFKLLGPVEAWSGGRQLQLASGKSRSILATLLLTPRTVVPAESLVDRLWGDAPPAKARETLSAYITRLRRSLQADGADIRLMGRARGYVLDVEPDTIDLHRFHQLQHQAGHLAENDDKRRAVSLARDADGLWRGVALAGVAGDWFAWIRQSLAEERRALLADRIAWELDLGRHALLTGELSGLLVLHPLDETLIACQMTALYRCGRPSDALSLYRRTRDQLIQEQGTEPGPALTELHQQILRRDTALEIYPRTSTATLAVPDLLQEPADRDTRHRAGEPARQPASRAEDPGTSRPPGQEQIQEVTWFAHPADDAITSRLIGSAMPNGAVRTEAGEEVDASDPQVADHLTARARAQDRPLGTHRPPGEPGTPSRWPATDLASPQIAASFETSYAALKPRHQLFLRRIGLSPGPNITVEGAAALAGVPLPEARATLGVLLDHGLLAADPGGQLAFADVIRELTAVRAAQDDHAQDRRQAVGRLLDYYLTASDQASAALFPLRRRIPAPSTCPPDIVPALTSAEQAEAWLESEWQNILGAARYAASHRWPRQCADLTYVLTGWMDARGHWDEAIAASTVALQECRDLDDQARTARAALALAAISQRAGRHDGTAGLAENAAEIYRSLGDQRGLAQALDQIGLDHQHGGHSQEALAYFAEARTLYEHAGDTPSTAITLNHSAIAHWHLGHYQEAADDLLEALKLNRDFGDDRGEAKTLSNLGKTQMLTGHYEDALASFTASLDIFKRIGGAQSQAILHHNIGGVHHRRRGHSLALAAYHQALAIYKNIGDLPDEADLHNDIAAVYRDADLHDEALSHYDQARQIAQQIGNQPGDRPSRKR